MEKLEKVIQRIALGKLPLISTVKDYKPAFCLPGMQIASSFPLLPVPSEISVQIVQTGSVP